MARNDDPASSGGLASFDAVFSVYTFLVDRCAEGCGVFVGADAADVEDRGGGEDVLFV